MKQITCFFFTFCTAALFSSGIPSQFAGGCAAGAVEKDVEDKDIYTHECTSWMLFEDVTKNGTHVLHKNRDAKYRNIMPLKSAENSPRKWIGLGDGSAENPAAFSVCMGMNSSGLATVVNSGEKCVEPSYPGAKLGTPAILRECLENCDTAAQAVEKVKEIVAGKKYSHGQKGSIFLFMDLKEGYVVETTAERCSVARYDHGYAFRANIWHNADMAGVSDNTAPLFLNSCNREFMVLRDLNAACRVNGRVVLSDILAMARDIETPKESPIQRTLCFRSTNSAATFVIDREFPDVLSTGYFLIGPPRHTLYLPVPVTVEKYPGKMTTLAWSSSAWKRFDEKGFDAEIPPEWKTFEAAALETYGKVREEARRLLRDGKKQEAITLLNATASAIWLDAEKTLGL